MKEETQEDNVPLLGVKLPSPDPSPSFYPGNTSFPSNKPGEETSLSPEVLLDVGVLDLCSDKKFLFLGVPRTPVLVGNNGGCTSETWYRVRITSSQGWTSTSSVGPTCTVVGTDTYETTTTE